MFTEHVLNYPNSSIFIETYFMAQHLSLYVLSELEKNTVKGCNILQHQMGSVC